MIGPASRCAEQMGTVGIVFVSEEALGLLSWHSSSSFYHTVPHPGSRKIPCSFWMLFCPSQKSTLQAVNHGMFCGDKGEKGNKQLLSQIQNTLLTTIDIYLIHKSVGWQTSLDSSSDLNWNWSRICLRVHLWVVWLLTGETLLHLFLVSLHQTSLGMLSWKRQRCKS